MPHTQKGDDRDERVLRSRSAAALYAAGAAMALSGLALPRTSGFRPLGIAAPAMLAAIVAVALAVKPAIYPRWFIHCLSLTGSVLITIAAWSAGRGTASATFSVLYVFVSIFASWFYSWPAALAHNGAIAALAAAELVLGHEPAPLVRWIFTVGACLGAGAVIAWVHRDRDKAEASLRAGEAAFQLLFANNPHPMWVFDRATLAFLEVNDAAVDLYGWSREEFLTMNVRQIRPESEQSKLAASLATPRNGLRHEGVWLHRRRDATPLYVDVHSHTVLFKGRDALVVVAQDVTNRRRAEEKLAWTNRVLASVVEGPYVAVFVKDANGVYLLASDRMAGLLGRPKEAIIGRCNEELLGAEAASALSARDEDVLVARQTVSVEPEVWLGGSHRVLVQTKGPMLDEDGSVIGVLGVVQDVTEQRRTERVLQQAYEREHEAARQLRKLNEAKNAFLSATSHELRTPLASVLGFATTLLLHGERLTADQRREYLQRQVAAAQRLDRLLSDLLDIDRLQRGLLQPQRAPTDIGELVERILDQTLVAQSRPIFTELTSVIADVEAAKVERIVENLLSNAVRYSPPGTPIWVRVRPDEDGVMIVVEDAGPGVPEGLREVIFGAFEQGPNVRPHAPGVGIGLSLVAQFAEMHGGRACVRPRTGGGSSFRVFLPLSCSDETAPAGPLSA